MGVYTVREAKPEEQRELTRLCVRATMHSGYDEEFIDRSMPSLTITLPEISGDFVRVAQDDLYEVVGVVCVMPTALQGIALSTAFLLIQRVGNVGSVEFFSVRL